MDLMKVGTPGWFLPEATVADERAPAAGIATVANGALAIELSAEFIEFVLGRPVTLPRAVVVDEV